MKSKRFFSAVLAALMLLCLLPILPAQAQADGAFVGNRTVAFTFDSSDLDNYANGGRAGVDFYLRRSAPDWLGYTLRGAGRSVVLTYSFDFTSFADYSQKISTLLAAQPDILYSQGDALILVEDFGAAQLLNSLQLALGESQNLLRWAKVTADTLTVDGEAYDVTAGVEIHPESGSSIQFRSLQIDTTPKRNGLSRRITLTVDEVYTDSDEWKRFVRRCKKEGKVDDEAYDGEVVLEITVTADNLQALVKKTAACLEIPLCLSVNLTEAAEDSCAYLFAESFFLDGFLEEDGTFHYAYTCPETMQNVETVSEDTALFTDEETDDNGETSFLQRIEATDQPKVRFRYTAPFRFEQIRLHTERPSALQKIQRRITLTAPIAAAELYHEVIKEELADAMPKGTVLEMYDQDTTRYYVLTFSSWFWSDIVDFTEAFVDTELDCADSWLPFGNSRFAETLSVDGVIKGFDPVYSVQASYRFPGTMDKAEGGRLADGVLTFADPTDTVEITYQHLHLIKLAVLVIVVAAVALTVVIVIRKKKKVKAADVPTETPTAEKEPATVE